MQTGPVRDRASILPICGQPALPQAGCPNIAGAENDYSV